MPADEPIMITPNVFNEPEPTHIIRASKYALLHCILLIRPPCFNEISENGFENLSHVVFHPSTAGLRSASCGAVVSAAQSSEPSYVLFVLTAT